MADDFYVGYQPFAAKSMGRYLRRIAVAIGLATVLLALALSVTQQAFAPSRFEYGRNTLIRGRFEENPYPILLADSGPLLLVAPWKHGLPRENGTFVGRTVALAGALIQRGSTRMLEVDPASIRAIEDSTPPTLRVEDLGEFNIRGEIVDSKCYLGVMNPGEGKVHRECAARCISGGIPPAFAFRDRTGKRVFALLTGRNRRPLGRELLEYVADPVGLKGRLFRDQGVLILETETATFHRE